MRQATEKTEKKRREGNGDFRGDLSYRKTHRAVHSASAFISFPRIHRFIAFHLYTPYLEHPRYRRLGILSGYLSSVSLSLFSSLYPPFFLAVALFRFLRFQPHTSTSPHHRFRSLACNKESTSTTLVNHS